MILTTQKLVFVGSMKAVNIDLKQILQIDAYEDGIGIHRKSREKTQYFLWEKSFASIRFNEGDRHYTEPFNGLILKCLIEGAVHRLA